MKRPPTKKDIRQDLERQVQDYLREGGEITSVAQGTTGLDNRRPWSHPFQAGSGSEPRQERTPVPEVVAAIEARKHKHRPEPKRRRPRKQWIYDDFGEPVRWVWKD